MTSLPFPGLSLHSPPPRTWNPAQSRGFCVLERQGGTIWQPGPCPDCAGWLSLSESFHRPGDCTHIHITNWLLTHWVTRRSPLPCHLLDASDPRERCHDPGKLWPSPLPWFSEYQSTVWTTPERAPQERNGWNCPLPTWPRNVLGNQWPACTFQPEHCPTHWP